MGGLRLGVVAAALVVAATSLAIGAATAAGPTPGVVTGWDGIATSTGQFRFVAVTSSRDTVLQKIATRGGRVVRFASVRGFYGIPLVSWDGTATGLTRDGKSLVLSTYPAAGAFTRFAVYDSRTLKVRQRVALRGVWSLDALSPDGATLFLIKYLRGDDYANYRVRAYDLRANRLIAGSIVDKREPEAMTGSPMTRATSSDARWAYTLYGRDADAPFIHALDTRNRAAVCIDLPWRVSKDALSNVRMRIGKDGLVLSQRGTGRLATVDLRTFAVSSVRAPVAPGG